MACYLLARNLPKFGRSFCSSTVVFSNGFKYSKDLEKNDFWKKKFRHAIKLTDVNRDGSITRSDFQMMVERYREMGTSEKHLKKLSDTLMKVCDAWGLTEGKTLTYDEFAENYMASLDTAGEFSMRRFTDMFEIIDEDGDGVISPREWSKYSKAIGVAPAHAAESFRVMDVDGDEKVSRDEFLAYNQEFFYSTEDKLKSSILFGPLE